MNVCPSINAYFIKLYAFDSNKIALSTLRKLFNSKINVCVHLRMAHKAKVRFAEKDRS